jgi:hypothetical protein
VSSRHRKCLKKKRMSKERVEEGKEGRNRRTEKKWSGYKD